VTPQIRKAYYSTQEVITGKPTPRKTREVQRERKNRATQRRVKANENDHKEQRKERHTHIAEEHEPTKIKNNGEEQ